MNRIFLICVLCISFFKMHASEGSAYVNPTGDEFPIIGHHAFFEKMNTLENYIVLKQCGFNIANCWNSDTTYISKILTLAEKAGIKAWVNCPEIKNAINIPLFAQRYNHYPANIGYLIWDEPKANIFNKIKGLIEAVKINSPGKLAYVNLYPNYASTKQLKADTYNDYVESFVKTTNPQFLSFDNYCIYQEDGHLTLRPGYFENLEIIRRICNNHGIPFWTYVLSTAHFDYPIPTEGQLLFEAFTSLAYGSKAIQYFGYATDNIDGKKVYTAPVDQEGRRRKVWYTIRNVNAQIQRVGQLLLPCRSIGVWHTGAEIPKGSQSLKTSDLPGPFRRIVSGADGVVISHLGCGDTNYLLIVNKDFSHRQKVGVEIDKPVTRITQTDRNIMSKNSKITLKAGGWALFSF